MRAPTVLAIETDTDIGAVKTRVKTRPHRQVHPTTTAG